MHVGPSIWSLENSTGLRRAAGTRSLPKIDDSTPHHKEFSASSSPLTAPQPTSSAQLHPCAPPLPSLTPFPSFMRAKITTCFRRRRGIFHRRATRRRQEIGNRLAKCSTYCTLHPTSPSGNGSRAGEGAHSFCGGRNEKLGL